MRKIILKISILLVLISLFCSTYTCNYVSAAGGYAGKMEDLINKQDNSTEWQDKSNASNKVEKIVVTLIAVFRVAGMCVAVTLLLVVAMKYMSAAPGEKADIKKASIGYVVGALVLFGAVGLLGILNSFAENIG